MEAVATGPGAYDPFDPDVKRDPSRRYAALRRDRPVCLVAARGKWAVRRHASVGFALTTPRRGPALLLGRDAGAHGSRGRARARVRRVTTEGGRPQPRQAAKADNAPKTKNKLAATTRTQVPCTRAASRSPTATARPSATSMPAVVPAVTLTKS